METRTKHEKKKEKLRIYEANRYATPEGKQYQLEANQKWRQKKRDQQSCQLEEITHLQNKVKSLQNQVSHYEALLEKSNITIHMHEKALEQIRESDAKLINSDTDEELAEEFEEPFVFPLYQQQLIGLFENAHCCKQLTSFSQEEFSNLLTEFEDPIKNTTYRGTERKNKNTNSDAITAQAHLFITLVWFFHYPTLDFLSAIFHLHRRTITRILKRTIAALHSKLQHEIRWPTDEEMAKDIADFPLWRNVGFEDTVCVIDGTEIRLSRSADAKMQKASYSGKKHQNSVNVMFMTRLNGEIIYKSDYALHPHDQKQWNDLNLRERFLGKDYAIMGDGGFTFNLKAAHDTIKAYSPKKSNPTHPLTDIEKDNNRALSQMRVVIENTFSRLKSFHVLKGTYRHFRNEGGQLDLNQILTDLAALTNRKIKQHPIRPQDWLTPEWRRVLEPKEEE